MLETIPGYKNHYEKIKSFKVHAKIICKQFDWAWNMDETEIVPSIESLSDRPMSQLLELKPKKVFTKGDSCSYFGMQLSDGQIAKSSDLLQTNHSLPENITKIDVFFNQGENFVHSMVFHGQSILKIGQTPYIDQEKTDMN